MATDQLQDISENADLKIDGVVIGLLLSINDAGELLVAFPGNPLDTAIPARSTAKLERDDVGTEVALLFENGNPFRPLIIGKITPPLKANSTQLKESINTELDGEHITLIAKESITLKCGKASITLTKAGKIISRGDYILSQSSGVHIINGGSVHLN